MGRQPLGAARRIDRSTMNKSAKDVFARLGVVLDPARQARGLSVADQQIVEIAKALSLNAKVLVMDEPTAALTNVRGRAAVRGSCARCANRARPCCSSRTGWKRCSPAANGVTIMRDGPVRPHRAGRGPHHRPDHPVDGRPGSRITVPQDDHRARRHGPRGRQPAQHRRLPRHLLHRPQRRDRGPVRTRRRRSQRSGPSGVRHRPGSPPGGSPSAGRCCPVTRRRRPWRPVSHSSPRTAGSRAWSWTWPSTRTSPSRRYPNSRGAGSSTVSSERDLALTWGERLQLKYGRLRNPVSTLSGGNQQKVVLGKWLARGTFAAHHRRADPRHRRGHEGRGAPHPRRPGRRRHGRADDLLRDCPRCWAWPTGCWSCTKGRITASAHAGSGHRGFGHARRVGPATHGSIGRMSTATRRSCRPPRPPRNAVCRQLQGPVAGFRELGIVHGHPHRVRGGDHDQEPAPSPTPHSIQQLLTGAALIALHRRGRDAGDRHPQRRSVGRLDVVGLSAYLVGTTFKHHPHLPVILGFVLGDRDRRGGRRDQRPDRRRSPGCPAWWSPWPRSTSSAG